MIIIILGLILVYLIFDFYQRFFRPGLSTKIWPELADRTGLVYEPSRGPWSNRSSPRVMGNYRGYEIKLDLSRVLAGAVDDGIASYRTRIVLTMNHRVQGALSLKHRWFFSRGFLRGQGLTIDDEPFDQRFVITSRPQDFAARVFAPLELRQRFLAIKELREFSLSNLGVRMELKGIESDVKQLHALFNLLADNVQLVKRMEKEAN